MAMKTLGTAIAAAILLGACAAPQRPGPGTQNAERLAAEANIAEVIEVVRLMSVCTAYAKETPGYAYPPEETVVDATVALAIAEGQTEGGSRYILDRAGEGAGRLLQDLRNHPDQARELCDQSAILVRQLG